MKFLESVLFEYAWKSRVFLTIVETNHGLRKTMG